MQLPQLQNPTIPIPEITSSSLANLFIFGFYSVNNAMIFIILFRAICRKIHKQSVGPFLFRSISGIPHYIFWYMAIYLVSVGFQSKTLDFVVVLGIAFHWSMTLYKIEMFTDKISFFASMEVIAEVKREK